MRSERLDLEAHRVEIAPGETKPLLECTGSDLESAINLLDRRKAEDEAKRDRAERVINDLRADREQDRADGI